MGVLPEVFYRYVNLTLTVPKPPLNGIGLSFRLALASVPPDAFTVSRGNSGASSTYASPKGEKFKCPGVLVPPVSATLYHCWSKP